MKCTRLAAVEGGATIKIPWTLSLLPIALATQLVGGPMEQSPENQASPLPDDIHAVLSPLVAAAKEAFGADLVSLVLFGSAAEGRLRATSNVNLLFVLERFDQSKADSFREPLRAGHAALKLSTMFVLQSELHASFEVFAVKFEDIAKRHRLLSGRMCSPALRLPGKPGSGLCGS